MNDATAALLDLYPEDRARAEEAIEGMSRADRAAADHAEAAIRARLGTFPPAPPEGPDSEIAWLAAFVRTAPTVAEWHTSHGIPAAVSAASLSDVGRQIRLHCLVRGTFGLETWAWLSSHFDGSLFELGRLQFALRRLRAGEPLPPHPAAWYVDVHIPATGPLTSASVTDSFTRADLFFPRYFPDKPVTHALCDSWLLDPYLAQVLPLSANLVRFQQEFVRYGTATEATADARYFLFRTRSDDLETLVPETRLQRMFVDRIRAGESWRSWHGERPLGQPES